MNRSLLARDRFGTAVVELASSARSDHEASATFWFPSQGGKFSGATALCPPDVQPMAADGHNNCLNESHSGEVTGDAVAASWPTSQEHYDEPGRIGNLRFR